MSGVALLCVTEFSGLSAYGLTAHDREISSPPTLLMEHGTLHRYTTQLLQKNDVRRKFNVFETALRRQAHNINFLLQSWSVDVMVWYGMVNVDLYSAIITKSLMRWTR